MTRYLLDTNIVSHVIRGDIVRVRERLAAVPMSEIGISVVTEAELRYGLAKRGNPAGLTQRVHEFLIRVDVLPWDSDAAISYSRLRTDCESAGITLASLDLMIAAHAKAVGATLVSHDRVFQRVPVGLTVEDWTTVATD
ncbi:type II toxin-antitoxin system VapC family toxin [Derxia lacustris]|uniref:type II toxin-antitoxin system VapC family toxin n=1 Tax=Derxia lacustris TaxID=764842 RepID=UPI000A176C97|nr:type II toxin-antitoxin system VapC family toxin [Derxia lacustris]